MSTAGGAERQTCAPDDVRSSMLWFDESGDGFTAYSGYPNPDGHEENCRVYWASHGCDRPRGHDGPHWCDCCDCPPGTHPHGEEGCLCVAGPPYFGWTTRFYGADVPWWRARLGRTIWWLRYGWTDRIRRARARRRRRRG